MVEQDYEMVNVPVETLTTLRAIDKKLKDIRVVAELVGVLAVLMLVGTVLLALGVVGSSRSSSRSCYVSPITGSVIC